MATASRLALALMQGPAAPSSPTPVGVGADPRGDAPRVKLFLSPDEAHAKTQLRRQLTTLNCDFCVGWVSPMKSPIPKNFSERLHRALHAHLLSGE